MAGIGIWYSDGDQQNSRIKLESAGSRTSSNSQAKLGAILEALRQNESGKLVIESDPLTSLRVICNLSEKYEDTN